jgi:hypothetical protein
MIDNYFRHLFIYIILREMNDRIQVIGRIRPMTRAELERGDDVIARVVAESSSLSALEYQAKTIRLGLKSSTVVNKNYKLDAALDENYTQAQVFENVIPLLDSLVEGYNCSLFTYGQTGKTNIVVSNHQRWVYYRYR